MCENNVADLKRQCKEKDGEITDLKKEVANLSAQKSDTKENPNSNDKEAKDDEIEQLKLEIQELRQELSEVSMSEYEGLESGRIQRTKKVFEKKNCDEEVGNLKAELELRKKEFEKERLIWAQEKEKVLRYQRQLQMNYVQMYRRTRALEDEVESLTIELELDKTGHKKKLSSSDLTQTIEL